MNRLLLILMFALPLMVVAADRVPAVSVSTFDQVAYYPQGSAPASAVSFNRATLSAQLQSTIERIPVRVADVVKQGDLLVQLDCRNAKAARESAKARHALARYQLQRASTLNKGKHVSEELLRTRESELAVASAALTTATIDVERCQVTAPFNGLVTQRIASVGEWVAHGQALLELVDLDNVEVSAKIADTAVKDLEDVREFAFVVNGERYGVQPRSISQAVDPISRTREVRLSFIQQRAQPGQSGRLIWQSAQRFIPADYLVKRQQAYGVFIMDDGKARVVRVPGAQEGRPFQIDLKDDTRLITNGRFTVQDNQAVTIAR